MKRVAIEGSDVVFECPEHENILRSGLRAGLGMPYDCSIGTCGECKIQIVSGTLQENQTRTPGLTQRDVASGRALACQAIPATDCTVRLRVQERYVAEHAPAYHTVRLLMVEPIGPEMMRCVFQGSGPAAYRPGQYARLLVPGTRNWRAFSMSNLPNDDGSWEFLIRPVTTGCASDYLFLAEREGELFTLDAPYGNAFYRPGTRRIVCIAGGAGLAPVLAVARAAAIDPLCDTITAFYGGRSPEDLCAERYLAPLIRETLGLRCHNVISGDVATWTGARGFVHQHLAQNLAPSDRDAHFYVSGPPAMVEAVLATLNDELGIPPERIFYDRFFG